MSSLQVDFTERRESRQRNHQTIDQRRFNVHKLLGPPIEGQDIVGGNVNLNINFITGVPTIATPPGAEQVPQNLLSQQQQ